MDTAAAAAEFEQHRAHLTAVAYRMLGMLADAEDAVQETYLRYARVAPGELRDTRAWLTTTVSRVCLDQLGSARARRRPTRVRGCPSRWSPPGPAPRSSWDRRTG
ncbi:MAG TPA: sigma factor [Streptosporangiaceae bacterium]